MSTSDAHDVACVAQALRSGRFEPLAASEASQLIRGGQGAKLFKEMFQRERELQEEAEVPKLMQHLERVVREAPLAGAYLMARLYALSWKTADHDVYNAIELWMEDLASEEAAEGLSLLANEPIRPAQKKACAAWATAIRARARAGKP